MKKMFKSKMFAVIITAIICITGTVYATNANEITYGNTTVQDAIDALYQINSYQTDYSTEEKVVGTWIDGKPLYQKTIDCGAIPSGENTELAVYTENTAEFLKILYAYTTAKGISLPYYNVSLPDYSIGFYVKENKLVLTTRQDRASFGKIIATIQYTKTTDSIQNN